MRFPSFVVAGVFTASLLSTPALARSTGISGASGKPLADGSPSQTCTRCHAIATVPVPVPTVEISGPTSVMAGTTNQYTFIMKGGPQTVGAVKIGGVDLAVDRAEATLEPVENSGLKKLDGELTHAASKEFTDGEVRFDFSMIAPGNGGVVTIYGAGNSANGDKGRAGDGVAAAKLEVTVQVTDGTDAGTGSGSDHDHDHDQDDDKGGGCSSTGGAPMLMFVLGAVGLTLLRRRRA